MKIIYAVLVAQQVSIYGIEEKVKVYLKTDKFFKKIENAIKEIKEESKKHFEAFGEHIDYSIMGTSEATNFALPVYSAVEGTVGYYPHSNLNIRD